jgi:HlyD family secretion protein
MLIKYGIPMLAVVGVLAATRTVIETAQTPTPPPPTVEPARAPFDAYIAGAGIVEASTENVALAALTSGVVVEIAAQVGQTVAKGDLLLRIDVRDLEAQLDVERAALAAAQARIERLRAFPRVEELRAAEARLVEAHAALQEARDQQALADAILDLRAMSREERNRRKSAVETAAAREAAAQAALDLQRDGAWAPDLAVSQAEVEQARARVRSVETQIERAAVRAPFDGRVLQVNVRLGEYAPTGVLARPLMLLGAVDVLHVRADLDENDAWRFRAGARAYAFVRGNREIKAPLEFVRVEPYVVPKRSLTGESTERVDTRVLQALYRFDPKVMDVYVGQQVDVFVEAQPVGGPQ